MEKNEREDITKSGMKEEISLLSLQTYKFIQQTKLPVY